MSFLSDEALERVRAAADEPDLEGTKYRLVRPIARGGMSVVWLVEDAELEREVALKVLDAVDPSGERVRRMLREARIVARLEHPGIVPIHDVGTLSDGRAYCAMKRIAGKTLRSWAAGPRALGERLAVFRRVCDAVAFAHARGVIHRDLKPENVIVGAFGEVVVLDWGVAREIARSETSGSTEAADSGEARPLETRVGTLVGTPAYMAPEQWRGEVDRLDERTDVFLLGGLLWFLLTGAAPFEAGRRETTGGPRDARGDVPRALDSVCRRAMAQAPADRYRGARDLADDVARFQAGLVPRAHRASPLEIVLAFAARHRVVLGLLGAYVVMRTVILLASGR